MSDANTRKTDRHPKPDDKYHTNITDTLRKIDSGPSTHNEPEQKPKRKQVPVDLVEEEGMESFPASDPPGHGRGQADSSKPEPHRPNADDV